MALQFTGDSEIQMIKVQVPVLVTKRDYGMYEVILPSLGPIEGGFIGQKLARKHFEAMFRATALTGVLNSMRQRSDLKEREQKLKDALEFLHRSGILAGLGGIVVGMVSPTEKGKDGPTEAKKTERKAETTQP